MLSSAFVGGIFFEKKTPDKTTSLQSTPKEKVCPELQCEIASKNGWKFFSNNDFSMLLPDNWREESNGVISSSNHLYYMIYRVQTISDFKDVDLQDLLYHKKIRMYEQENINRLCKESDACGKITQYREIETLNGLKAEFIVSYDGLGLSEKRGTTEESHQTIITDDKIYRFWTSEQKAPLDLLQKYPQLNPTPSKIFSELMLTVKIENDKF